MQRKVAAVVRGGRGDGGRGRGRGHGPGGCGGRGHSRGGRCAKPTVSARNFSDEEWPQFSGEEQGEEKEASGWDQRNSLCDGR